MRRIVGRAALWLAFGAMGTTLLAWCCVGLARFDDGETILDTSWPCPPEPGWIVPQVVEAVPGLGVDRVAGVADATPAQLLADHSAAGIHLSALTAGLPLRAFFLENGLARPMGAPSTAAPLPVLRWGWTIPQAGIQLPFGPLWPGLIVDAVALAVAGRLCLAAARGSRSRLRRRSGVCPSCRYPCGGATRCPECGRLHR